MIYPVETADKDGLFGLLYCFYQTLQAKKLYEVLLSLTMSYNLETISAFEQFKNIILENVTFILVKSCFSNFSIISTEQPTRKTINLH